MSEAIKLFTESIWDEPGPNAWDQSPDINFRGITWETGSKHGGTRHSGIKVVDAEVGAFELSGYIEIGGHLPTFSPREVEMFLNAPLAPRRNLNWHRVSSAYWTAEVFEPVADMAPRGSFRASEGLASFFLESSRELLSVIRNMSSPETATEFVGPETLEDASKDISEAVQSIFSALGHSSLKPGHLNIQLGADGKFTAAMEVELATRLPMRPSASAEFFHRLYSELTSHLSRSPISAAWGRVELVGNAVLLTPSADLGKSRRQRASELLGDIKIASHRPTLKRSDIQNR